LAVTQKKYDETLDVALRARADAENARRRAVIDVENAHKYALERFAKEMLHVVDSLERGLQTLDAGEQSQKAIHEGLELTYKLMLDSLDKFGIKVIDPMGETFDPKRHEALSMVENPEVSPNTVVNVIQKGFTQHERVLRHAKVIVAKG
jgi:molecular chaperone GrpE